LLTRVAVVGAGFMGHGIAQACAQAGCRTALIDVDEAALATAMRGIETNLVNLGHEQFVDPQQLPVVLGRLSTTTDYARGVEGSDLVIEAVPEDLELKRRVFTQLERCATRDTILATNTASLRITEIAAATSTPERVIGTHWFFPPYVVPLVEVIPGERTSATVLRRTSELLISVGKIPSVSRDVPGFVLVRLLHALLNEAVSLLESGVATAQDIDNSFRFGGGIGFALYGPLLAHDLTVNKKTTLAVAEYLYSETGHEKFRPPDALREKVSRGETGMLAGRGWYDFAESDIDAIARRRDALFIHMVRMMREAGLLEPDARKVLESVGEAAAGG